jgi:hypothetical protein
VQLRLIAAFAVAGSATVFTSGWPVTPAHASDIRMDALRRAAVRVATQVPFESLPDPLTCRFIAEPPAGTTAKFTCASMDGGVIKVKYGRNPEIHAEAAATRLLTLLGYPADDVRIAPRVRCYGCPHFPFFTMQLLSLVRMPNLIGPHGDDQHFTDFEWAAVERKFRAAAIETDGESGWAWWELKESQAPRAELDALRLLAVFLAHWDNKADNQRLVCLDAVPGVPDRPCAEPVAMIQDLGATFGPYKVNLAGWRSAPIWSDRATCTLSMRSLPFHGGTFPDTQIGEEGRVQLANALLALSDSTIRQVFEGARFGEYYSATDDDRDLDAWTAVFRRRVDEIATAGPCPAVPQSRP